MCYWFLLNIQRKWRLYSYEKPKIVVEYNLGKSSADLSDQMTEYSSPLRRTVKLYEKLTIKLILNTCIVNALVMFKQVNYWNIEIPDFRMKIAMLLTKCQIVKLMIAFLHDKSTEKTVSCNKTNLHPIFNNFCWVTKLVCGLALSWWKAIPFRLAISGCFCFMTSFN